MFKMKRCSECGSGNVIKTQKLDRICVGIYRFERLIPCIHCNACDESSYDDRLLRRFELYVARSLLSQPLQTIEIFKFAASALRRSSIEVMQMIEMDGRLLKRWARRERHVSKNAVIRVKKIVSEMYRQTSLKREAC